MPQVASVAGRLCANVSELKGHARRLARLVEVPAQGQRGQRPPVVVLDQVRTLPLALARGDALDDFGKLPDDLSLSAV